MTSLLKTLGLALTLTASYFSQGQEVEKIFGFGQQKTHIQAKENTLQYTDKLKGHYTFHLNVEQVNDSTYAASFMMSLPKSQRDPQYIFSRDTITQHNPVNFAELAREHKKDLFDELFFPVYGFTVDDLNRERLLPLNLSDDFKAMTAADINTFPEEYNALATQYNQIVEDKKRLGLKLFPSLN